MSEGKGVGWEPVECNEATKLRCDLGLAVLAALPVTFTHYSMYYFAHRMLSNFLLCIFVLFNIDWPINNKIAREITFIGIVPIY